jgi:hypothetical protein
MLFPRNKKKTGPFSPSPSLYQIGSKLFVGNGFKTPKFLSCSTNCNTILQFLQGTLGTMKRFATKVVCIYARNPNLNPHFFMNFMPHPHPSIQGLPKPMNGSNVLFFWEGMKQDVRTFVVECEVCQHNKGQTVKSPGTLQPLMIPSAIWRYIYMDFIVGLPKSGNKSVIMVVVDILSKYAHFCALQHPFTTAIMAQIFMDNIFKLHGMPNSIVSDRDPTFTSNFW